MIRYVTHRWSAGSNRYKFAYDFSTFHSRSFMAVALTKIHLHNMLGEREDWCMAFDEGLADRIRFVVPRSRATSERKMFGGLAFLMNGHMFCGVVKSDLMLRLGPEATAAALSQPHTRPMDFTGKPLKSMVYVEPTGIDSDDALCTWIKLALTYVMALPPKKSVTR